MSNKGNEKEETKVENKNTESGVKKEKKAKQPGKKKPVKLFVILGILLLIVIWIASCVIKAKDALAGLSDMGTKETVEVRDLKNTVSATGKVVSVESRTYTSSVVNVDVAQLNVKVGDYVNAGDVIAVLDSTNLQASLDDANISRNASAGISSVNVNAANRNLANSREVQNVDQARADKKISDAIDDLNEANAELADAKKELDDANNAFSYAKGNLENARAALEIANANYGKALEDSKVVGNKAEMDAAMKEFNDEKARLVNDLSGIAEPEKAYLSTSVVDGLAIDNMSSLTTTLIYSGSDSMVRNMIDGHVAKLQTSAVRYEQAKYESSTNEELEAAKQAVLAAQSNLEVAENSYNLATTRKETATTKYKTLNKTADSAYDMVTSARQNKEDVTRNDNMSVASSADSVRTSNLNASTATLSADSEIRRIEEQIDNCDIIASISGVVTAVGVKEGDNYAGGTIATVEDVSSYKIETQIDEYEICKVKEGQKVAIKATGTGTEELEGIVSSVAPRATTSDKSTVSTAVTYKVVIDVLTANDNLRMDMTAKLNIITDEVQNAMSISYDAIQTDEEGNTYVEVLDGEYITLEEATGDEELAKKRLNQKEPETHKVYVNKGMESDFYVQVISDELSEGDVLFIKGSGDFSDLEKYLQETGAAGGM